MARRKRETPKRETAPRFDVPGGGAIGVLLLNAFSDYIPYMTIADLVSFLVYESVPTDEMIARWEVVKTLQNGLKTAEKPQPPIRRTTHSITL